LAREKEEALLQVALEKERERVEAERAAIEATRLEAQQSEERIKAQIKEQYKGNDTSFACD
jgi:hypothetical protein